MTGCTFGGDGDSELKRKLISAFRRILSPQVVNDIRITRVDAPVALGFILTRCPVENRSHLEDFEAHLDGKDGRVLDFAVVGGRRIRLARGAHRRSGKTRKHHGETGRPEAEPTSF